MVSVGREARSSLAGWFWLRISQECAVETSAKAESSEGLTRTGGTASKVAHSLRYWWRPQFLTMVAPPQSFPEYPYAMPAGFPQSEWFQRKRAHQHRIHNDFYTPIAKGIYLTSPTLYWSHKGAQHHMGGNSARMWIPGSRSPGTIFKAGHHS